MPPPHRTSKDGAPRGDRNRDEGPPRRGFGRRKVCRFCVDKTSRVDYKDLNTIKYFVTERGKMIPRRINGNCARHQRQMAKAIKRARMIALVPYSVLSS